MLYDGRAEASGLRHIQQWPVALQIHREETLNLEEKGPLSIKLSRSSLR